MSNHFDTLTGFRKAHTAIRGDVLESHGYARNAKNVRLATGYIALQIELGGAWVTYTTGPVVEMTDRVRLGGNFRLVAKV